MQEESNYEIFYQLRSKKDLAVFDEFPGEFRYLGKHSKKRDLTFSSLFQKTTEALTTLGFSLSQQTDVFNILRAILLLGNLEFIEIKNVLEKSRSNAYCFISVSILQQRQIIYHPISHVVVKYLFANAFFRILYCLK